MNGAIRPTDISGHYYLDSCLDAIDLCRSRDLGRLESRRGWPTKNVDSHINCCAATPRDVCVQLSDLWLTWCQNMRNFSLRQMLGQFTSPAKMTLLPPKSMV